jgi:hypothetical protein
MSLHLRPALIVVALVGTAAGAAFADTPTTAQIYLQRGADGRSVLTDRPSASAVTERTWQMDREDPVAARQRELEVRRQAEAVSVRVQRSIEAQERRASEDEFLRLRLRVAQLEHPNDGTDADGDSVVFAPLGFRPFGNRFDNHRPQHRPSHPRMRPTPFRRSALLESR